MIELSVKKYRITLETFLNRSIVIEYRQATFKELIEMLSCFENNDVDSFLCPFLCERGLQEEEYKNLFDEKKDEILQIILDTYGKGFFKKTKGKAGEQKPFYAMIGFLMEFTNETLDSLLNLTWEQISFLLDGAIYMLNEKTKEGRERNAQKSRMDGLKKDMPDDVALDLIKKLEEDIAQRKASKNG